MEIQLNSQFLKNHFQADSVPYDVFESALKAADKVLSYPEDFPNADQNYYDILETELLKVER